MYIIPVTYADDVFAFETDLRQVGRLNSIVNHSEIENWKSEIKLSLTAVEDLLRWDFVFWVGYNIVRELYLRSACTGASVSV